MRVNDRPVYDGQMVVLWGSSTLWSPLDLTKDDFDLSDGGWPCFDHFYDTNIFIEETY